MSYNPKAVFENPEKFWGFLITATDDAFEGQYFDRKEAGRLDSKGTVSSSKLSKVQEQIQECVSAFANSNKQGGLLVLGISKHGEVKGVEHLNEDQLNRLTNINNLLKNQSAQSKEYHCQDANGLPKTIYLIYVPYTSYAVFETLESFSKAWRRQAKQNLRLNHEQ